MQDTMFLEHPIEARHEQKATKRAENAQNSILFLRPAQIHVPFIGKRSRNRNAVIRLSESIKRYGMLEPLPVRVIYAGDGSIAYELLGNEQHWQAACLAGVERVPCVIPPAEEENSGKEEIFNQICHKTLHIFDQARAFQLLIEEFGLTQGEIARRVGISQSAIANKLRLLQFSPEERYKLLKYELSERHARALLRLKSHELRDNAIETVRQKRLTVAGTEELVEEILSQSTTSAKEMTPNADVQSDDLAECHEIRPRKFALQSLQPLYNSIDKTLSIFRKTGRIAEMERSEQADGVKITIRIPK